MNRNYTYIIASTPLLNPDFKPGEGNCDKTLEWIASQLDAADLVAMKTVLDGFDGEKLDRNFYERALSGRNDFIRKFFKADLNLRNAKVAYLNRALGRPEDKDIIHFEGLGENTDAQKFDSIFEVNDLLEREKAIDRYLWDKADEITLFQSFTLGKVLAVVVKLKIIGRWLALDPAAGRQMMRELTADMRGTYGKIEFDTKI